MEKTRHVLSVGALVLLALVLVVAVPACMPQAPAAAPVCKCPVPSDYTSQTSDPNEKSYIVIGKNTNMTPSCQCMSAEYISWKQLQDPKWAPNCLKCDPEKAKAGKCASSSVSYVSAIDVRPNNIVFVTPTASGKWPQLSYMLPKLYPAGKTLTILQFHEGVACTSTSNPWQPVSVPGVPAKVRSTQDFADGPFTHTSVYLLVELAGDFSAYGIVNQPIAFNGEAITIGLDVNGSPSNPELEGKGGRLLPV